MNCLLDSRLGPDTGPSPNPAFLGFTPGAARSQRDFAAAGEGGGELHATCRSWTAKHYDARQAASSNRYFESYCHKFLHQRPGMDEAPKHTRTQKPSMRWSSDRPIGVCPARGTIGMPGEAVTLPPPLPATPAQLECI